MSTWEEVAAEVPDLAASVRARFDAHGHKTMATLRADGSPRISGTEAYFSRGGELWVGSMPGARKGADLRRDARVAIHSGSDEPAEWTGDAKVAGRAVLVTDEAEVARIIGDTPVPPGPFDLFRIDLTELVLVGFDEGRTHLEIESWHDGTGYRRMRAG
jgi:hypothetical protein